MKRKSSVASLREAYQDWRDKCPIRERRLAKGMTQAMLGALVGASGWTVSKWESGGGNPTSYRLANLEKVLDSPDLRAEFKEWKRSVPR